MAHIAIFTPIGTGHINTIMPLALALKKRGHRVSFLNFVDLEEKIVQAGVEFINCYPRKKKGAVNEFLSKIKRAKGLRGITTTVFWTLSCAKEFLATSGKIIQDEQVDILLVDQICMEGLLIAQHLEILALTICSALPLQVETSIPPCFTLQKYAPSPLRNLWYRFQGILFPALGWYHLIALLLQKFRYGIRGDILLSARAGTICHEPRSFEFPRKHLPANFHFVGPMHSEEGRPQFDYPREISPDEKILYVSFGTLHSQAFEYRMIADACRSLDRKVVMAVGDSISDPLLQNLPPNVIVLREAPQLTLLKQALLIITHGGLNSTLEALTHGVPMLTIPMTNDQPGVAARIVWTKTGIVLRHRNLTAVKIKNAIMEVLNSPHYRTNAIALQQEIAESGGIPKAISIIENLFSQKIN